MSIESSPYIFHYMIEVCLSSLVESPFFVSLMLLLDFFLMFTPILPT